MYQIEEVYNFPLTKRNKRYPMNPNLYDKFKQPTAFNEPSLPIIKIGSIFHIKRIDNVDYEEFYEFVVALLDTNDLPVEQQLDDIIFKYLKDNGRSVYEWPAHRETIVQRIGATTLPSQVIVGAFNNA